MDRFSPQQRRTATGDVVVLALLTLSGFATHLTLGAFGRMLVTLLASLVAWAVVAPAVGVYRSEVLTEPRFLWRVVLAGVVSGPLATFLRGAALDRDIPWVFVLVTILTNTAGLLVWRVGYGWWTARRVSTGASSTTSAR
jgi:hypothetical protein